MSSKSVRGSQSSGANVRTMDCTTLTAFMKASRKSPSPTPINFDDCFKSLNRADFAPTEKCTAEFITHCTSKTEYDRVCQHPKLKRFLNNTHTFTAVVEANNRLKLNTDVGYWLDRMRDVTPSCDEWTANAIIRLCTTSEDVDLLFRHANMLPFVKNIDTFNLLIGQANALGKYDLTWWLDQLDHLGIVPDAHTLISLISLCRTEDDIHRVTARDGLTKHCKQRLSASKYKAPLAFNHLLFRAKKLSSNNVRFWLQEMERLHVVPDSVTLRILITLCTTKEELETVRDHPALSKFGTETRAFNFLLTQAKKLFFHSHASFWLQEMERLHIEPDADTLGALTTLCINMGELEMVCTHPALSAFGKETIAFNCLISQQQRIRSSKKATFWFREMERLQVTPDVHTISSLITQCVTADEFEYLKDNFWSILLQKDLLHKFMLRRMTLGMKDFDYWMDFLKGVPLTSTMVCTLLTLSNTGESLKRLKSVCCQSKEDGTTWSFELGVVMFCVRQTQANNFERSGFDFPQDKYSARTMLEIEQRLAVDVIPNGIDWHSFSNALTSFCAAAQGLVVSGPDQLVEPTKRDVFLCDWMRLRMFVCRGTMKRVDGNAGSAWTCFRQLEGLLTGMILGMCREDLANTTTIDEAQEPMRTDEMDFEMTKWEMFDHLNDDTTMLKRE